MAALADREEPETVPVDDGEAYTRVPEGWNGGDAGVPERPA
jgi:hypothetical protein